MNDNIKVSSIVLQISLCFCVEVIIKDRKSLILPTRQYVLVGETKLLVLIFLSEVIECLFSKQCSIILTSTLFWY